MHPLALQLLTLEVVPFGYSFCEQNIFSSPTKVIKTDNYTLPNTFTFSSLEFWGLFQLVCFFFRFRTYLSSNLKTFIALSWPFCCKVKCVQYITDFLWLLVVTCMQVFYKNEIIVGGLLAWFRVISPERTFVSDFDKNAPRSLRGAIILTNSWLWKKGLQSTDIFFNLLKAKPEKKRQII